MMTMTMRKMDVLDRRRVWAWARRGAAATVRQAGRNLAARRLLSFPHGLVFLWILVLLWGERWIYGSKIGACGWHRWERWPKGATPHRVVFIADPQIIDPHSYPGRRWPLSALTVLVTDNYMRRGYDALQRRLHPDSLFFLGDLFDGGREWKTAKAGFVDPHWGTRRPVQEQRLLESWHRKYGEGYWLREYGRFSDIFFRTWNVGGRDAGPWQRGRKLVASLPGNHDLGFGAQVQVPVRERFDAFFGDVNRVDVVGNHTFVSVDSVSLGADTSSFKDGHDLRPIYGPVREFLDRVQSVKRRAVRRELDVWYGVDGGGRRFAHVVEDLNDTDVASFPSSPSPPDAAGPDLPTILLSHVPLYRDPGTPCGPQREHRPPMKPRRGQKGPVIPDHGNAISVSAGYQYQNVLSAEDSARLVGSVGNVSHVFSGDDHDYCDLVHGEALGRVRETTVKSFSMAMGVSRPGFVMASLWNPVDAEGRPLPGAPPATMQTHLCLMPSQLGTYAKYAALAALTLVVLAGRALLVPVLHLTPFALSSLSSSSSGKANSFYFDDEDVDSRKVKTDPRPCSSSSSPPPPPPLSASSTTTTTTTNPNTNTTTRSSATDDRGSGSRWGPRKSSGRKGGGGKAWSGPRITLDRDFYDGGKARRRARSRRALVVLWAELWTTVWRVTWMTCLVWLYLAREG
ncbi:hypothetical protein L249_7792 [Ophiocordyceps polyrhachis-furcata BCC 54312]|uniref:Uncharacterized protein n=1 Tax=Ophiocordyceps polyrhachis-furcata BCC 54312 TaxID=1330021 RepID=A0A367L0Q9_9HYPO|nr:hypothetical protein L249_7792 [Ophiocordyceps polyrhachis-furcata BCC 54312]